MCKLGQLSSAKSGALISSILLSASEGFFFPTLLKQLEYFNIWVSHCAQLLGHYIRLVMSVMASFVWLFYKWSKDGIIQYTDL